MSATAPSTRRSAVINDAVREAAAPRTKTQAQAAQQAFPEIASNPFYVVMFDPNKTLDEKKAEVTRLTTSTLDSKQDKANMKAFETFREWLAAQQTELAEKIIALTNVDSMAELQAILKDMNTDLIAFEDKMGPLMDIIESIHHLRTNDLMGDAFRDIQREKEEEAKRQAEIARLAQETAALDDAIAAARRTKADAQTKRGFFGLGGMTSEGILQAEQAQAAIDAAQQEQQAKQARMAELRAPRTPDVANDANAVHKARLRELLDLSRAENQGKMVDLRDAAIAFITTAKSRTGSLRGQFDSLANQIETAEGTNQHMIKVYAVLNDGVKDAALANAAKRGELETAPAEESSIAEMTRKEKLRTLDTHVGQLTRAQGESVASYGALNQQAIRIHTMRGATEQQIETARLLNTEGVAATADRMATVLTAVSGAALGEAAEAAKDTLNRMRASTTDVASREVIRVAMGTAAINQQLETVFQELETIREVQQTATGIARNATSEMLERMEELQRSAAAAKQDLEAYIATSSLADAPQQANEAPKPALGGFPEV